MTFRVLRFPVGLLLALTWTSCGQRAEEENDAGVQTFPVRGVVQKRMDDPRMLLIDHEEIPGFMPRMIMPFHALDASEFEGLDPGMTVTLTYHYSEAEARSWVTDVRATGETGPITVAEEKPSAQLLRVGNVLPDHEFLDESGTRVRLSDYRGMPVALTFVFSRCPVPEYCPRMMHHFAGVRDGLEADPDRPGRYQLLTISFDSGHDRPEILKAWGASFGHRPGDPWRLLSTPNEKTIASLAERTGLRYGEKNGTYQHNLRTLVLDGEGAIRALFTDETWSVEELIREIKAAGVTSPTTP